MDNPQLTPAIGSGFALMAPLSEPVRDARVTAAVVLRLVVNGARWSVDARYCTACGRTAVKHKARGLCLTCHNRACRARRTSQTTVEMIAMPVMLPAQDERQAA